MNEWVKTSIILCLLCFIDTGIILLLWNNALAPSITFIEPLGVLGAVIISFARYYFTGDHLQE